MRLLPSRLARIVGAVAVLLLSGTALAQPPGRVNGVVRDEDGEPIKGATVTAQSTAIGVSYTASTDEKGRFILLGLRPGEWAFIAGAPGFAASGSRTNVRAASNLNAPLLFSLRRNGPGAGGALERFSAKDLQGQLEHADRLFNQQKWDDAIAAYRALAAAAEPLAFVNLQVAAAYVAKNDPARARTAYEDLLKVDATNEKAIVGIADLLRQQGDVNGAIEFLTRAAQAEGTGREVFMTLGELLAGTGQHERAGEWFARASKTDPYWGKPLLRLGQLASTKGNKSASDEFMQRVIAVDPASPEASLARTALGQAGSR